MCEFQLTMIIVKKFKPYEIRFTLSLIILFSFSTFIYSQNPESLSNDEQILDKKLSHLKTEILTSAEKDKLPIYNTTFSALKPLIESSELYKTFQKMPKGGLLHSHSGGIANAEWLVNKASEYNN